MRVELMAVRISGALPGSAKQRSSDDLTDAGTASNGSCSSCHGFVRIPAPTVELPGWSGAAALRGVGTPWDGAILWCHGRSKGGGTNRAPAWSFSTMACESSPTDGLCSRNGPGFRRKRDRRR